MWLLGRCEAAVEMKAKGRMKAAKVVREVAIAFDCN